MKSAFSKSILRHLLQKLVKTDFKIRFSDMNLGYKHIYRQFLSYLLPLFFQVFLDDPFFEDFKFLISQKWTVIFKNRNFWLHIRIPWVDTVLCSKFHEIRSKTAINREEMLIFFTHHVGIRWGNFYGSCCESTDEDNRFSNLNNLKYYLIHHLKPPFSPI